MSKEAKAKSGKLIDVKLVDVKPGKVILKPRNVILSKVILKPRNVILNLISQEK